MDSLDSSRARIAPADDAAIAQAAAILRAGGLVGMPTETVYGLAGLATSDAAVARIYAVKGRPTFNPLIAHFDGLAAAAREARLDATAERLALAFWPGPLTLVAPVAGDCRISLLARAGLDTLALRVPGSATARALIAATGAPLAAPSANRSGAVSPTRAEHVAADLGDRIALILDAGPCVWGVESTVVACLPGGPRLLRPGAVAREQIEAALGRPLAEAVAGEAPSAPGALASHYAPNALLRLDATEAPQGAAVLDFGGRIGGQGLRLDLSAAGDLAQAAANLFAHLRALDAARPALIVVAPIPERGLGAAINDRLRRAAAPRPAPGGAGA
ncbi:MAG: threonylcarbamoyl-AMP synthase [Pseudomonadota bacterium]|nr:threonylcarbamoyl-AMP synthase [Pseudomonadota bacterium]